MDTVLQTRVSASDDSCSRVAPSAHRRGAAALLAWVALGGGVWTTCAAASSASLLSRPVHLCARGQPVWADFAAMPCAGAEFSLPFAAGDTRQGGTLCVRQLGIHGSWRVRLNGHELGELPAIGVDSSIALAVPAGDQREGENRVTFQPIGDADELLLEEIRWVPQTLDEFLNECRLEVRVTDADSGQNVPSRLTIVDTHQSLAPIRAAPNQRLAVRTGVVYTADGYARLGLPAGDYTIYAGRGFECSIDRQPLSLRHGDRRTVRLRIRREVATPGLVACDTHIHTRTLSGHGDATLDERVITLAGEGIELPIATEHNLAADYSAAAERQGVRRWFTPVIGDEVTTGVGHFNIFPIRTGAALPDFHLRDWPKLLDSIHATPGVQFVTLNHPRDLHADYRPFDRAHFNPVTGRLRWESALAVNGIELVNSSALQSDFFRLYHDWFALLNRGHRLVGVGASDCHDVNRFIVGQGRTYVRCRDDDPGRLDVAEACHSLLAGRALVSLGLLTQMTVNDRFEVGDLVTNAGSRLEVSVTVRGPAWVRADRVMLFADGQLIHEQPIQGLVRSPALTRSAVGIHRRAAAERSPADSPAPPGPVNFTITWWMPKPAHDVYLVAIAIGPGVVEPYWPVPHAYQATSPVWEPHVFGSTNPIWLDADGDGRYTSPREYARRAWDRVGGNAVKLLTELASYDQAVAEQAADLCGEAKAALASPDFERALGQASPAVRRGFEAVLTGH